MYEEQTYEVIKERMLQPITRTDKREGSFVGDMMSSCAYEGERMYHQMDVVLGIAFLTTSSGEYIDMHVNPDGIYRKEATTARGEVTFTGAEGTEIPAGSLCGTASGLLFEVTEEGTIGAEGAVTLPVEAAEAGDRYNVLAGYVNMLPVNINGVTGVVNEEGFLGGADRETDEALRQRGVLHKQKPATSGNPAHYLEWAMEVNGVGNARIFPLDKGPGTVGVMPITNGGRATGEDILSAVYENIEMKRPIGATVSVYAPEEVMIGIDAEISISTATTMAEVLKAYRAKFEAYIKESVFTLSMVDYYKVLSMFYEIKGVTSVKSCTMNGGEENITIGAKEIQVAGNVTIREAVE